jgi:dTDP-L-rhamnose 4-epimerase
MKKVLITGGAGFIGSHLADELLAHGYRVRVLDCLEPQVHGEQRGGPTTSHPEVELQVGDVCDKEGRRGAARASTPSSTSRPRWASARACTRWRTTRASTTWAPRCCWKRSSKNPVQRLVVASSMSLYGEGLYRDTAGQARTGRRAHAGAAEGRRLGTARPDGGVLQPMPTPETKQPALASVYALSKYDQERCA